jgi:hypothetical protein
MKIGILTSEENKNLINDDQKLLEAFRKRDADVSPVVWSSNPDWESFDSIVIRSPWDYARRWEEFSKVAETLSTKTKLVHPWDIVKWNADKSYLQKIGNDQIKKIPTIHYPEFNENNFKQSFQELNSEKVVFKPKVGASGVDTFCVSKDEWKKVTNLLNREVMAQPFIESIVSKGEYSLICFDHKFSHSVLKSATKSGEFRIQDQYGGIVKPYLPTETEIQAAQSFLNELEAELGWHFPYARVDIAIESSGMYLMELEVIEPELFFRHSQGGEDKFVSAILKHINR